MNAISLKRNTQYTQNPKGGKKGGREKRALKSSPAKQSRRSITTSVISLHLNIIFKFKKCQSD